MNHDSAWRDNSSGPLLQYDFLPPAHWTDDRVAGEQAAIAGALAGADAGPPEPHWLRLARRLPSPLRAALLAELAAGNRLTGIGSTGWPNDGSIVATMGSRFSAARRAPPPGVVWRELNDPHYATEELSQKVGPVEHLVIT